MSAQGEAKASLRAFAQPWVTLPSKPQALKGRPQFAPVRGRVGSSIQRIVHQCRFMSSADFAKFVVQRHP